MWASTIVHKTKAFHGDMSQIDLPIKPNKCSLKNIFFEELIDYANDDYY